MSYRSCIVFCGNLPGDVRSSEVEDLFYKFGALCLSAPFAMDQGHSQPYSLLDSMLLQGASATWTSKHPADPLSSASSSTRIPGGNAAPRAHHPCNHLKVYQAGPTVEQSSRRAHNDARQSAVCNRDARDAVEARDGYEFGGQRLRVEISRGAGGPGGPPPRGSDYGGGGGGGGMGGGSRYPRERGGREPPPVPRTFEGRGTGFRAVIKGLPMSASWQDLKVGAARSRRFEAAHRACPARGIQGAFSAAACPGLLSCRLGLVSDCRPDAQHLVAARLMLLGCLAGPLPQGGQAHLHQCVPGPGRPGGRGGV